MTSLSFPFLLRPFTGVCPELAISPLLLPTVADVDEPKLVLGVRAALALVSVCNPGGGGGILLESEPVPGKDGVRVGANVDLDVDSLLKFKAG
jgi:hypothetical protein